MRGIRRDRRGRPRTTGSARAAATSQGLSSRNSWPMKSLGNAGRGQQDRGRDAAAAARVPGAVIGADRRAPAAADRGRPARGHGSRRRSPRARRGRNRADRARPRSPTSKHRRSRRPDAAPTAPRSAPRRPSCCTTSKPMPPAAAGATTGAAEAGMSAKRPGQNSAFCRMRLRKPRRFEVSARQNSQPLPWPVEISVEISS